MPTKSRWEICFSEVLLQRPPPLPAAGVRPASRGSRRGWVGVASVPGWGFGSDSKKEGSCLGGEVLFIVPLLGRAALVMHGNSLLICKMGEEAGLWWMLEMHCVWVGLSNKKQKMWFEHKSLLLFLPHTASALLFLFRNCCCWAHNAHTTKLWLLCCSVGGCPYSTGQPC